MATQKAGWERLPKVSFFVIKSVIFSFIYLLNPPISWARKVRESSRFTTTKIKGKERETKETTLTKIQLGIYREVPGARIPGGSEDVMLDLAIRQLVKNFQRKTKELEAEMEKPGGSSKL